MKKVGESLYTTDEKPEPATQSSILQGSIEQSNVRPVYEITKMMDLVRTYEQVAQAMTQADDLSKEAVKELGQTPNA
jgi:flagellar basal-body rod protein FlgF